MRYANITSIPSSYIVAFFSSLVPASALSSWGSMPQLGNTMIREGARFVFACQGIEPCQANADAGTRRPQVRLRRPPLGLKFNVLHAIAPTEGSDAHADVLPLIANEVEVEGKLIFAV